MTNATVEAQGRPAEVLLVEDNYGDVLLTREAFRSSKVVIHLAVASDGEEALSMLRREGVWSNQARPDLIMLDLNLPRMDGREALAAIKCDPALRRIPVIVMTSSRAQSDVSESYDLGANSYIIKPVEFGRLQVIVASLVSFWFRFAVLCSTPAIEQVDAV